MALWAVPWNRLRSAVLRVQMGLAGIVGDSYVLLADPVQRRAILDRVHRDLEWLAQRCRRVVVIAHSQGAAVAELVLSNRDDVGAGNIHAFATLGAGVQTLTAIQNLARSREVNVAGWAAIGCALLLGAAIVVACTVAWQLGATIAAAALLGLAAAAIVGERAHPGRPKLLPGAARFRPWLDFFAAKDLVPYGPLVDPADAGENYRPKQVRNLDSWLADHTSYWQNPEQVVGPLAREIGRAAAFAPLERLMPDDVQALDRLERARLSRLGFLGLARVATAIATALLVWAAWPAWLAIGRWAFDAAQSVAAPTSGASRPAFATWIEAATVLLPLLIHRALIQSTFDGWTTAEVERLLRRSAGAPATHWAATFALLVGLMLAGTAIYVWPLSPWQMLGATTITAIGFVWLARRAHLRRVDGNAASPAPVRPSAAQS
jgi:hypothetical protein